MCKLWKLLEEEMDRQDCDLVAIRQVYAFENWIPISESVDGVVGEVTNANQAYSSKFRQCSKLEN